MAPGFFARLLPLLLLSSAAVLADLTCKQYKPKGTTSNKGMIHFQGLNGLKNVPAVNATADNPTVLDVNRPDGTRFQFQTCNSTSLGYTAYSFYGDCEDDECFHIYTDYVRIISTVSGSCLTSVPLPNSHFVKIIPKKCNANPTDGSQLFLAQQFVEGPSSFDPKIYYMSSFIYHKEAVAPDPNRAYSTWQVAADNKTILYDTNYASTAQTSVNAVIEM